MQHITVPVSEIMTLMVNDETARINNDDSQIMAIIDGNLHILVGDFKGIETSQDLEEIIKRNL